MTATGNEFLGLLVVLAFCAAVGIPALLGVAGLVYALTRYWTRRRSEAWQAAADALGLTFSFERGAMTLTGRLDGVDVRVDTTQQRQIVARPDRAYGRSVPWTYVDARPVTTYLEMQPADAGNAPPAGFARVTSGDAALDARYRFLVADGAALETLLPPSARDLLRATPEPLFVTDGAVRWLRSGLVMDAARLEEAIRLAARLAALLGA